MVQKIRLKTVYKNIVVLFMLVALSIGLSSCSQKESIPDSSVENKDVVATQSTKGNYKDIWGTDDGGAFFGIKEGLYLTNESIFLSAYHANNKYIAYQIKGITVNDKYYPYSFDGKNYEQHDIVGFEERSNTRGILFEKFGGLATMETSTIKNLSLSVSILDSKWKFEDYVIPVFPESAWKIKQ